jgi:hypothetical protein
MHSRLLLTLPSSFLTPDKQGCFPRRFQFAHLIEKEVLAGPTNADAGGSATIAHRSMTLVFYLEVLRPECQLLGGRRVWH